MDWQKQTDRIAEALYQEYKRGKVTNGKRWAFFEWGALKQNVSDRAQEFINKAEPLAKASYEAGYGEAENKALITTNKLINVVAQREFQRS